MKEILCYGHTLILIHFRDENEPATIVDTSAVKPDGWLDDEKTLIPDPDAIKPADWYVTKIC